MAETSLTHNALARKLLAELVPSGVTTLHVTIGSSSLADWVANWAKHAKRSGIAPLIVGALDGNMLAECESRLGLAAIGLRNTSLLGTGYVRHERAFLQLCPARALEPATLRDC